MTTLTIEYLFVLLGTMLGTAIISFPIKIINVQVGAVDHPNARRINTKPMPSAGGLSLLLSFSVASLLAMPMIFPPHLGQAYFSYILPLVIGGIVVGITGYIDDVFELKALSKMGGILLGALIIYAFTDLRFDSFKIPFGGPLVFFPDWLTFLMTVVWIVGITNAVNFLDGLDGLVSGVSVIILCTLGAVAFFFLPDQSSFLIATIFVLVAAIMGFVPYNFHPAIMYLGDTGSLFIGFMIAVFSLQGLKNATAVAVISPVLILGVPIVDTGMAIIRRQLQGKKFYEPDRMHLHHRLLALGFTHRGAVFVVYGITLLFALTSLLLNFSSRLGGIFLLVGVLFGVELLVENIGILGSQRKPLMRSLKFIGNSDYRQEQLAIWQHRRKMKKRQKSSKK